MLIKRAHVPEATRINLKIKSVVTTGISFLCFVTEMTYRISFFELRTRKPLLYRAIQSRVLSDTSICSVVAETKWIVSELLPQCCSKTAINSSSISIHLIQILRSTEIGNCKCRKKVTSSGVFILQITRL
jgi:hypothetical protein